LIVGGISNYTDNGQPTFKIPFGEYLLLDADTGKLLRELPMGVLGKTAVPPPIYTRAIAVNKNVYMVTGQHVPAFGQDTKADYYRAVMFHLAPDNDEYSDDNNDDLIQEDNN
jgi:hypothetical protein